MRESKSVYSKLSAGDRDQAGSEIERAIDAAKHNRFGLVLTNDQPGMGVVS
jgi:hypothetical protein